jgi:hypothetical protein
MVRAPIGGYCFPCGNRKLQINRRRGTSMRAILVAGVLGTLLAAPGLAADKLTPDAIKTAFFTGQEFVAATPSGVKFKMVFSPDGKVTRTPSAGAGARGEGTWKASKEGFCTTWKGAKQNCYTLITAGDNKWSVMSGPSLKATWSK